MIRKTLISACAMALVVCGLSVAARAQVDPRGDRAIYFTFSRPVALPGVTLAPGKYLFKLADSRVVRSIVQVFDGDGVRLYGTIMAIPAERRDRPNDPEIRFMETAAGSAVPVSTYWYPGTTGGWEFIYPRKQAVALAKNTKQPVLTTASDQATTTDQTSSADLVRVDAAGQQTPASAQMTPSPADVVGTAQSGQVAAASASASNRPASTPDRVSATNADATMSPASGSAPTAMAMNQSASAAPSPRASRTSLPQTASTTPVVAAVGGVALLVGFGLAFRRRHTA